MTEKYNFTFSFLRKEKRKRRGGPCGPEIVGEREEGTP